MSSRTAASATAEPAGEPDLGDLFHAAFRGLRRRWAHELAPFEMTPHQWRALNTLARHGDACAPAVDTGTGTTAALRAAVSSPEGVLRLKALAGQLRIAPRSATEVVDQLEAKGLVERIPDPHDRRAVLVRLTDTGQQLRSDVERARREQANEYFARLDSVERAELARLLGVLADEEHAGHRT
ncbi:MarR family winged helix-turn-helix transcriptional regulator [Arthrobacter sp. JSM 101049]|uniref:MarR family winged helix-turn-helix transcriptional regulator n=1 Tax=Arthrobacter sp. JSM 101049 TaxID=929097 RepID=UPI0035693327